MTAEPKYTDPQTKALSIARRWADWIWDVSQDMDDLPGLKDEFLRDKETLLSVLSHFRQEQPDDNAN